MKNMTKVLGRVGIIAGVILGAVFIWFYEYLIPNEVEYPVLDAGIMVEETLEEKQLSLTEMMPAIFAWYYFQNNTDTSTGVISSEDGGNVIMMKDLPDYILAIHSAKKFGIISKDEYSKRLSDLFLFFGNVPVTKNGTFFSFYNLDTTTVDSAFEIDLFSSLELASVLGSIITNNEVFRYDAFEMLTKLNLIKKLVSFSNKESVPLIEGKTVNLYIKALQLPDSLRIINTASVTEFPLNFSPFFHYLLQNKKYWSSEQLKTEYLNIEEANYRKDSTNIVFTELSIGSNEQLFYYMDVDSSFSVYSKKMFEVEEQFISTSGAFIRKLMENDYRAGESFLQISELFNPEKGWYEGKLVNSGDIITYINAKTNATVLNVLCLETYKNYY